MWGEQIEDDQGWIFLAGKTSVFNGGSQNKNSWASKWISPTTLPHRPRNFLKKVLESQEGFPACKAKSTASAYLDIVILDIRGKKKFIVCWDLVIILPELDLRKGSVKLV